MKRPATVAIGIICGIVCAGAVFAYLQSVKGEAESARAEALDRYGGEQVEVCVATRDIASGEKLDASNTTAKLWLADLVPSDAVRSVRDVYGEQVGTPIFEGEVVTSKRFSRGERQIDVPAGLSVLSIPVKDVQAIGGSIALGQHVDVYATGAAGTELLASDVAVVSSSNDSEAGLGGGSISWVALAVEPRSVQELIAASQKTELYLVLPGDEQGGASDEA